ncbi:MAG: hypothetical protein HKN39_04495 [Flavobacteriales bacterium]|nr:hypothetical protein [Flavobacteriales bacterium]
MSKKNKLGLGIIYILGIAVLLMGIIPEEFNLTKALIGSALILSVWIICIRHAIKNNVSGMWLYLLLFAGGITLPAYLLKKTNSTKVLS